MSLPPLNCDGCRACCLSEQIELHPEMGDDPSLYETVREGGKIKIAPRANGGKSCRYLGPSGCTIYDKRPYTCRVFDCRVYMALITLNRQQRRDLAKRGSMLPAVWAAAKARMT